MKSKKIRIGVFDFPTIPDRLDSTRIILRRYDPSSRYCAMMSNYGCAWTWVRGRLYMQKPHIPHNPGIAKRNKRGSYINITTDLSITRNNHHGGRREFLHRCVAKVWVRVPRKLANLGIKLQIDHINGDRYDNRPKNLRWCTQSQNIRYSFRARKGLPV